MQPDFLARLDGDTVMLTPDWVSRLCEIYDNALMSIERNLSRIDGVDYVLALTNLDSGDARLWLRLATSHASGNRRLRIQSELWDSFRAEAWLLNPEPISAQTAHAWGVVGEIGEIVVKGPQVTASYYNRAASTVLAKIADPLRVAVFYD